MSDEPVRLLLSERDARALGALVVAAQAEAARCAVVSIAPTADVLRQNLVDVQPEVAVVDAELIGEIGERDFLALLASLIKTVAIVLLPTQWSQLQARLEAHERVRDVVAKPASPARIVERAIEIGLAERARRQELEPGAVYLERAGRHGAGVAGQKVIAVGGFKGGPGKTTLAVNLWYQLCRTVGPSLLMGFDTPDDVRVQLGREPRPNMLSFFRRPGAEGLEHSLQQYNGFDLILAPDDAVEAAKVTPEMIRELILTARDRDYPAIVMDVPPTFADAAIEPLLRSNLLLLVIEPDYANVSKAIEGIRLITSAFDERNRIARDKVRLVINKVTRVARLSVRDVEGIFRRGLDGWCPPVVGLVPYDEYVREEQVDYRLPLVRGGPFAEAIERLAQAIVPLPDRPRAGHRTIWRLPRIEWG
jgi:MinD-like ATPase involved in chromosome partitioning or flagellar assembly